MVHKSWTPEETPKIAFGWSPGSWVGRKYRWLNDIKGFVVTHLQTPALSARSCSEWSQLELIGTSPACQRLDSRLGGSKSVVPSLSAYVRRWKTSVSQLEVVPGHALGSQHLPRVPHAAKNIKKHQTSKRRGRCCSSIMTLAARRSLATAPGRPSLAKLSLAGCWRVLSAASRVA